MSLLEIKNLKVNTSDKEILKGIDLKMNAGEVHAIMGKNGSGKTTLSYSIMGHPDYDVTEGDILLDGKSILELETNERARERIFLGMQYPTAIPGVSVGNFLRSALKNIRGEELEPKEIRQLIKSEAEKLKIPMSFLSRSLNDGFSGGEKKKLETLQLNVLAPRVAIMDETDSGLDIDALKLVADSIQNFRSPDRAVLMITHYQRILNHIEPDFVHVMIDGQIVKSGGPEIAHELEKKGYEAFA